MTISLMEYLTNHIPSITKSAVIKFQQKKIQTILLLLKTKRKISNFFFSKTFVLTTTCLLKIKKILFE